MYTFYNLVIRTIFPLLILRLLLKGFRNRGYWHRIGERFGFIPGHRNQKIIWVHAVSVGEVHVAALLINRLMERYADYRVLVTTMTPTGSDQVGILLGEKVDHCYVPYDYPSAVRRFLNAAKPEIAIIMETELWPNLFRSCHQRGIPLLVSNVRMSESSMRGYLKFSRMAAAVLGCVSRFAIQSAADAERMRRIGAIDSQMSVTGSIKFEIDIPASLRESSEVLRRQWGQNRNIWMAASTHDGEDEIALNTHRKLLQKFPDLLLVLVPRHPERFGAVERLAKRKEFSTLLRSDQHGQVPDSTEVLIGDTMGELQLLFGAIDVGFVGGSFVATGGHNILEASAMAKPVVVGPHTFNFSEITRLAVERDAAVQIQQPDELVQAIAGFLESPEKRHLAGEAGKMLVEENRGALARNIELIGQLLPANGSADRL